MNKAPDLSGYTNVAVTASTDYSGSPSTSYNPDDIATYKYLKAEPAPAIPVPTVTDAKISISGATGTGGAYKIDDTVTATWDNTAATGDNNSGVTSVTMDFSQFGGTTVTATNSGDVWMATYTITAGSIDTTNRNVSVTATSAGGSRFRTIK